MKEFIIVVIVVILISLMFSWFRDNSSSSYKTSPDAYI